MTRARRGASLVLSLVCLCLAAPVAADAADFNVWGAEDVNAPAAWSISRGAGVKVAVVDTGVLAGHEELHGRVAAGGWGFDGSTDDTSGHGTAIAAVIAADPDNGTGIEGVAPDASVIPFRAFYDDTPPDAADVVEALDRAGASGARVVNASFATLAYTGRTKEFNAARATIDAALAAHPDTLYVTAAGNEGNDNDSNPVLPCNAGVTNLICVGAYDPDRHPWSRTNYGDESVDLYAPGQFIKSATIPFSSSYTFWSGTSMSSAYVSGVAALLFAKVPQLTPEDAIGLMLTTSRQVLSPGNRSSIAGSPDAVAALQEATADRDHDGIYDILDDCTLPAGCEPPPQATPTPAPTATPQPTPTPAATPHPDPVPQLRSLTAKVTRCKAGRACRKSATVKLTPDRRANVSVRVDRRVCSHGRCRWSRVLTKALSAGTRGASIVVRGKRSASLPKGTYRVVAVPSSVAGTGRTATRTFPGPLTSERRLGVLAFGDSITNGGGELQWGVALQSWALWVARGLGVPYSGFAVDGARAADVAGAQVTAWRAVAGDARYDVGCLYIGVNDVRAGDWAPDVFAADHTRALAALGERCDRVLAVLLPLDLGRPRAAEVERANALIEAAAARRGALLLDLRGFGARNLVMTDHVHPTAFGQVAIAERALDVLARDGMDVRVRPATLISPGERTRVRSLQGDWTYIYRRLKVLRAQAWAAGRRASRAATGRSDSSPTRAR